MKFAARTILAVFCLTAALPAQACSLSSSLRENPARAMVTHAEQVAWARALVPPGSFDVAPRFETLEVLKGDVPRVFTVPNSRYVAEQTEPWRVLGDGNGHRRQDNGRLYIVGSPLGADCSLQPHFIPGEAYLVFLGLDVNGWAAYEMVRSEDDLWLRAVRKAIEANTQQ